MKLTDAEEKLMEMIWQQQKVFMKDLLEAYSEPKPAPTTVATLLKRMIDKGFVGYKEYGNSREYYPIVTKEAYFGNHVKGLIKNFFNNSTGQFASFFTSQADMSQEELEELRRIIDDQLKSKKS